jgi:tRNA(Glu) U13 pseudouridine synthase TruD
MTSEPANGPRPASSMPHKGLLYIIISLQEEKETPPHTAQISLHLSHEPLTFPLLEWSVKHKPLTLKFTIPKGCYATSVLREVMKVESI